jgi:hypothetical protein
VTQEAVLFLKKKNQKNFYPRGRVCGTDSALAEPQGFFPATRTATEESKVFCGAFLQKSDHFLNVFLQKSDRFL